MSDRSGFSRRDFVRTGAAAGAGLVIGFHLPGARVVAGATSAALPPFEPNAWIRVGTDGLISIIVDEAEMGQGSQTAVPQMIADELEADWSSIRVLPPPVDPSSWIRTISTGGSTTVRQGWEPLRRAGATAREMLRQAAADRWGIPLARCEADRGAIVDAASGRRLSYGELAERAAGLSVPQDPPLKDPRDFRYIGVDMPRTDIPDKVAGKARFGLDITMPEMAVATVAKARTFGATVRSFDATDALAVPGVRTVVQIDSGIAVVGDNTWAALKGREALRVEWDHGPGAGLTTEAIFARWRELAGERGEVEREEGNVERALSRAVTRVEATYELPFLDHAPMEPMNCTAVVREGSVEVWAPTQSPTAAQRAAAQAASVSPDAVVFHTVLSGGGFGRRLQSDFVTDAVQVAKQVSYPVKVMWTREDTTRHGFYRPATLHRFWAGLDEQGWPVAWAHRIVGPPPQGSTTGGAANPPYDLPNFRLDYHLDDVGIPVGPWRSVANTQNGFTVESFIDELAAEAGKDPYVYRHHLMSVSPRLRRTMELAAEKARWGSVSPRGVGRGLAAWTCFGGYAAQIAEVEVSGDEVRVRRVVCAIDCGTAVNPRNIEAQVQGGIVLGLTAALKGAITIADGGARESNFHDYPLLLKREMPTVEVHIVPSREPPGGVGEPPVPPSAPAVANAIFNATGRRVRKLPITEEGLRPA